MKKAEGADAKAEAKEARKSEKAEAKAEKKAAKEFERDIDATAPEAHPEGLTDYEAKVKRGEVQDDEVAKAPVYNTVHEQEVAEVAAKKEKGK